jgi:hypothetical protein
MSLALYPSRVRSNEVLDGSARPRALNGERGKPYATIAHNTHVRYHVFLVEVPDIHIFHNTRRSE